MPFDLSRWQTKVSDGAGRMRDWVALQVRAAAALTPHATYLGLCAMAFWPLIEEAQQAGPLPALGALATVAAGVGGNLLAEQIQRWRDGADRQAVEAWVADVVEANPEAREDFDAVLLATDAVPQVQAGLSNTDRAWFDGRLRQELTALGNLSRFEAHLTGSGAIASGHARAVGEHGVLVEGNVGGDVIIGDKTTVFDTRGQTIGSKQIISGDYHDNRRSGPTYVTNIEHAESLAIGTGAQVLPQTPPSPGTAGVEPSDLRRRLNCLDDVELDALCLDHFPSVYDKFARGLRRDEKVNLLLDYVRRHPAESGRLATFLSGC